MYDLSYKSYGITYIVQNFPCSHSVGFGLGVGSTLPEQSHSLSEVEINQYLKYNWIMDQGQHGTKLDLDQHFGNKGCRDFKQRV